MPLMRLVVCTFSFCILALSASAVFSQGYPNKPIRIITAEVGGGADVVARLIAQGISGGLGQQVIVENRGGSVVIPAEAVAKAPPDGYTTLLFSSGIWTLPFMQKVSYDPVRDFSPITLAVNSPNVVVLNPSLPVKSVKELIALAKAKPGSLSYCSGAAGSANHLAAELFKLMAGVDIIRIPYKGGGPAITGLIGGESQLMFAPTALAAPHINSGRLRALAVTSADPSTLLPTLPTVAASLPGYESGTIYAVFSSPKTPAAIIDRLNHEIVRVLNLPDVKEKLFNTGVEVVASSPGQLAAALKAEMAKWGKVIKEAGIRSE